MVSLLSFQLYTVVEDGYKLRCGTTIPIKLHGSIYSKDIGKKQQKKLRYKREKMTKKGMAEVLPSHIESSATDSILVI
jgi:hypothetical protein